MYPRAFSLRYLGERTPVFCSFQQMDFLLRFRHLHVGCKKMYLHLFIYGFKMIDLIGHPRISPISSNMAYFQNDDMKCTCLHISFSKSDDLAGLTIKQLNHHVQIKHPHPISSQTNNNRTDPKTLIVPMVSAADTSGKFLAFPGH